MARYYNRRRFARRVRRARRSKRSSLSRVKRDILKCNFPTKVKFMGLTERKVMFLTKNFQIEMENDNENQVVVPGHKIIVLDPLNTDNVDSLGASPDDGDIARIYNWDKICILGIYIKFQPRKNMWSANGNDNITPVKCIYSSNLINLNQASYRIEETAINQKQVFSFNSNEAFTMYLPAPPTMSSNDACVHKSKTWWSLYNLKVHNTANDIEGEMREDNNTTEEDEELPNLEALPVGNDRPYLSAGRLYLTSEAASYNVTINYKVALKG